MVSNDDAVSLDKRIVPLFMEFGRLFLLFFLVFLTMPFLIEVLETPAGEVPPCALPPSDVFDNCDVDLRNAVRFATDVLVVVVFWLPAILRISRNAASIEGASLGCGIEGIITFLELVLIIVSHF